MAFSPRTGSILRMVAGVALSAGVLGFVGTYFLIHRIFVEQREWGFATFALMALGGALLFVATPKGVPPRRFQSAMVLGAIALVLGSVMAAILSDAVLELWVQGIARTA